MKRFVVMHNGNEDMKTNDFGSASIRCETIAEFGDIYIWSLYVKDTVTGQNYYWI